MPLVDDDHVVKTLPAQRAHDALGDGIRLRRAELWCLKIPSAQ